MMTYKYVHSGEGVPPKLINSERTYFLYMVHNMNYDKTKYIKTADIITSQAN